ncbi:protein rigor mortis [Lucilia cuprina]|uniref:protein rigor mortis n=1 Tax=Lucilia cuprina TaxID=7375 RepID=UPI001F065EF7|nr:protein rigor mortis [Lucilia cuprina]
MVKIPLVPQWNLNNGCVCTPDGGFLYAGSRSINFISSIEADSETPKIQCFHTRQGILSLDVDPHWGQKDSDCGDIGSSEELDKNTAAGGKEKEPAKLFAALLQDNSVQIWDFNKGCAIQGHKAHLAYMRYMEGNGPSPQHAGEVLISYMCNRNVLSVDNQDIVVYCVASNSFYRRPMFISSRNHQMTSLKCSPYNENHFAIGTKRGLVLLCDLQKMATLYTLRGHDTSITSLAWNRVDITNDIVVEKPAEAPKPKVAQKPQTKAAKFTRSDRTIDTDDIFDIYDYDYLDNEFGAPSQEMRLRNDFVSDFVGIEKPTESSTTAKFDFAEACQSLKEEINALRDEPVHTSPEQTISLEECKLAASSRDDLSSCGSDGDDEADDKGKDQLSDKESSDGSLVRLACRTPSSEESVDVDGMHRNKQQNIICQAEVHSSQSQDNEQLKTSDNLGVHSTEDDIQIISEIKCSNNEKESQEELKKKDNEVYDILLASSSADGGFCIWNATTGATCDSHKVRSSHGGKNTHIEISWISPTSVIVNNKAGELQMWCMQPLTNTQLSKQCGFRPYKFKETKRRWSQRSVISFACSPKQHLVWSISSYREISMENIQLNKIILNYSCVSTNIGAMQECPDDMNKIALGFSDRRIGIIDISKMTTTSVHIDNFVQRIESNVMSLVWSPDCKKLAYGTMEGRIGILNIEGSNKQPFTYNSICGKPIYSISWQDKFLYVVCNDRIAVYEDDANKRDPYVIPDIDSVACVSLRNNYLFVGTQNGQLKLYARTGSTYFQYELKTTLDLAPRYISDISWSPIATNKLAVVANANNIHILEFNYETGDLQITRKIEINATKAANGCAKWSNRNENYFLTCGFDGAVRIWDLSNDKNPEHFVKIYHCPMTCGLFLPTDEEVILCSGKSAALEFIDMRVERLEGNTGKSKRANPRTLDTVQWATKALTRNDAKSQSVDKKLNRKLAKTPDGNIAVDLLENKVATDAKIENGVANSEEVSTMLEKLHLQKAESSLSGASIYMKNPLTLLYLTTKEINKDALDLMFSILSSPKSCGNKSLSAKLFGTKAEAKEVLADELKNHQGSETKGISSLFMPQLTGNLKEEILKCVQAKQLCEWHVSLAPSISYSFWQKCCQAYAEQLIEQGYALQAAAYMLAIHQQQDAIEMLMEKKFYKEALLIARIYLQPEDPLNNTISEQWITHLYANGNLTGAALLCLLTKQNNRAYECLAKIRNTAPEIERVIRLLKSSDI